MLAQWQSYTVFQTDDAGSISSRRSNAAPPVVPISEIAYRSSRPFKFKFKIFKFKERGPMLTQWKVDSFGGKPLRRKVAAIQRAVGADQRKGAAAKKRAERAAKRQRGAS